MARKKAHKLIVAILSSLSILQPLTQVMNRLRGANGHHHAKYLKSKGHADTCCSGQGDHQAAHEDLPEA